MARKGLKRPRSPGPKIPLEEGNTPSTSLLIETITIQDENSKDNEGRSKKKKFEEKVITVKPDIASASAPDGVQSTPSFPEKTVKGVAEKIEASNPMRFFLSTVTSVPQTKDDSLSLSFADLFDPSLGNLKESVQFNFMVEFGWLLAQYCQHRVQ